LIYRKMPLPGCADRYCNPNRAHWRIPMMDVLMVALGLGWFALAIGYAYACERL
jgi:hypothetical protein